MKKEFMTLYIYYYEDENVFTDEDGHVIYDTFDIITPNDIYLFKHDPAFNSFRMVSDREVIVQIIYIPGELCRFDEVPIINFGR